MTHRQLRIVSQSVFLTAFFGLFFLITVYGAAYSADGSWFLRANPFSALCVQLAAKTIVWPVFYAGLFFFLVSIVFGRIFCGFVCPLGTLIDASDRFLFNHHYPYKKVALPKNLTLFKYGALGALIFLAFFSALIPLFFDPISLLTRLFTIIAVPLLSIVRSDGLIAVNAFVGSAFQLPVYKTPLYYAIGESLILVCLIFGGAFFAPRFYCRVVCPSGAFMGLLGRFALFHRKVNTAVCHSCGLCAKNCPTAAIVDKSGVATIQSECIVCGVCTSLKNVPCSRFKFEKSTKELHTDPNITRRTVFGSIAVGALLLPLVRADALVKQDGMGRFIRPPGALPEKEFVKRCIGCGACYKVCPTNAIQPCTFSDGIARVFSPKIVPRIGGCEEKCHVCGYVCPTGALRPLPYEVKKYAKIGTAVIHRQKCLAWSQKRECLVCDETCPYNAIEAKIEATTKGPFKVPVVYENLCTGCGMCEMHCPIKSDGAIVVYQFGENRRATGNYLSTYQKNAIDLQRNQSDSNQMSQGFFSSVQSSGSSAKDTLTQEVPKNVPSSGFLESAPSSSGSSSLPTGFE